MTQVLVDVSHLSSVAWYPAKSAEEAGQKAFAEHFAGCPECLTHSAGQGVTEAFCEAGKAITQYDAKLVLKTNLVLKLDTLKQEIGIDPDKWVFVKDGHAAHKYEIFPEYKGNRDRTKYDPRPLAEQYLKEMLPGAKWVYNKDQEADDTIASLAYALTEASIQVVVVSGDKDLWQLLEHPGVKIYSPSHKCFIASENIEKAFDLTDPKHIALHKALWGDSGDNVPNAVPRMQKQLLPLIKASDGTLNGFMGLVRQADLTPRCKELLASGLQQVATNYSLVKLDLTVVPEWT